MFTFEIEIRSHDFRQVKVSRVRVAGSDDIDASITAIHMAHETCPFDGMPISCDMVDFPI